MSDCDCGIGKAIVEMCKLYGQLYGSKVREECELKSFLDAARQEVARLKDNCNALRTKIEQAENNSSILQEENARLIRQKEELKKEQAKLNLHILALQQDNEHLMRRSRTARKPTPSRAREIRGRKPQKPSKKTGRA